MPEEPGVYLFLDGNNKIIYVGKAINLKKRVSSYFSNKSSLGEKTRILVSRIKKIKIIIVQSEVESLLLEANLIKKYLPLFNVKFTDSKAYPLIKITIKDKYPKVLTARRQDDNDSLYFGPYPSSSSMRLILKFLRKIFPYQSVLNHSNKPCFYYHLGLCPCPTVFNTNETYKVYKENIKKIIQFLNGKTKHLIKDLEKERDSLSKKEKFEDAGRVQRKIDLIEQITSPVNKPFEYELNPNLSSDLRSQELDDLLGILKTSNVNVSKLNKIECYDISNISGKFATGSMVVFINGKKENALYRRFKIRKENEPNDFLMMQEVIERRLNHKEWSFPNLIVVDGGKGQVSSVKEIIDKKGLSIPVIGLAKREETIITSDFKEVTLPKNSKALLLIMRIRDEAHRFAITYHKKLRSKFIFG